MNAKFRWHYISVWSIAFTSNAYYYLHTLKATAKATLFIVLFCRNSIRYLFENLDFEVLLLCILRNGKKKNHP